MPYSLWACMARSCLRRRCSACCTRGSRASGISGARCSGTTAVRATPAGFLRQTVGGHVQAAGKDVILAHCLLKNRVPRRQDYALLTGPALRYMGVDPGRAGLVPHVERYEHFGDVECYVGELAPR